MSVALGRPPDLPGYCAPTVTLMRVGYTSSRPVHVSDFALFRLLVPRCRLISASCSSRQRFASSFLQIPSRPGHPCRAANISPCRVCRGLSPPSECALPGAQKKAPHAGGAFSRVREAYLLIASPLTSTSTRRFGARQAINSFIAVIVQLTPGTGCVLPMPRVSILSLATPFDTR